MAGPFAALERFFERLVERPIGRLFQVPLESLRVERRLERAMAEGRHAHGARTIAPDRYRVHLNQADLSSLLRRHPSLEAELAEVLHGHARGRGWILLDRPRVSLHARRSLARGDLAVDAEVSTDESPAAIALEPAAEATAVFVPQLGPQAVLIVREPRRPERRRLLGAASVRVGRARDNDLVLADGRVSRHHGLLTGRQGTLIYRDLDSANGTFLGGSRVAEVALGSGDVLRLGDTTIRVEEA